MKNLTRLAIVPFFVFLGCGGGTSYLDAGAGSDGLLDTGSAVSEAGAQPTPDAAPATVADVGTVPSDATTADTLGTLAPTDTATSPDLRRADSAADVISASIADARIEAGTSVPDTKLPDVPTPDVLPPPTPDAAAVNADADAPGVPDAGSPDQAADAFVKADAMVADAANADASTVIPVLSLISPSSGTVGQPMSLTIAGTGFESGAVAYFDGQALETSLNSPTSIVAQVTSAMTTQAGLHAVSVANATNRIGNTLYVTVGIPAGAPEILDYSPDNGLIGDTITIVGNNLTSEAITITGPNNVAATPGATGSASWRQSSVQTVKFTIPANWQTGPIVVTNSKGSSRGKIFNVGQNLAHATGATVQASSEYSPSWAKERAVDNDLSTSWFSAVGDCATDISCTTVPWIRVVFPSPQTVSRIAIRGDREYPGDYDFLRANVDVVGDAGVLWSGSFDLPEPDRDLDIILPAPVVGATSVKFTSLADKSKEPGLSEVEVF